MSTEKLFCIKAHAHAVFRALEHEKSPSMRTGF